MDIVVITALDQEGRGVARREGKVMFVEGALVGEEVAIDIVREKSSFALARADAIERASPARVEPPCPYFGTCGGCSLQHLDPAGQVAMKQRVLEDALWHIGRVRAGELLAPIHGVPWGYRQRARFSVRDVSRKGGVLVGFHERKSSFVADMKSCLVVPPRISALLPELRALIESLSIRDRVPQIELAIGEGTPESGPVDALVLRVLAPPTDGDHRTLSNFESRHRVRLYLQSGGPDSVRLLDSHAPELTYSLPDFGVSFAFGPTDFTQVNEAVNRVLVRRALALLDPVPGEHIADFFCGVGNFTLPIARGGANVVGVEGSRPLVERARANAERNDLAPRARFEVANLFEATRDSIAALGPLDKALIDPPREGAIALMKSLPDERVQRLVYVSCNPATLARDAGVLVHQRGFALAAAGVANMFPHTTHVESLALFARQ
ncbi:MAG TPA: 23S rRNA (uracil(1939)-C(5))-methyltransferase RlmD [Casimicrobiaceae bacterium]|jgi:23S rRNA (uracil1939-C5)-methyltransferase|nr:23S rRNA (uracil(1939)-C(5))-methyltransferase RlmD [Casimicrobiaceae bacterium]